MRVSEKEEADRCLERSCCLGSSLSSSRSTLLSGVEGRKSQAGYEGEHSRTDGDQRSVHAKRRDKLTKDYISLKRTW